MFYYLVKCMSDSDFVNDWIMLAIKDGKTGII
jgi:hypothetical protein